MELRDFIVTPLIIILVYAGAYFVRPYLSDSVNRKYFFPALSLKILGALALGFIYQFYYLTGDTFIYHTNGSRVIWDAFMDSPLTGFKLIFSNGNYGSDLYQYASNIYSYSDPNSFMVVRLASLFDLITFSTYSATAVLFAVLSFLGTWSFYLTFYKQYPHLHRRLAIASFFIPSVFFWGSGILKDTVTLACIGIATYMLYLLFFEKKYSVVNALILLCSLLMIFSVKKFILQAYVPAVILWIGMRKVEHLKSAALRIVSFPIVLVLLMAASYYSVVMIGKDDKRYAISKIAQTSRTTAYDIRYWTGKDAGSGYSLGDQDGSFTSMFRLAPSAINVALFRPYLWEIKGPLMLLSALESSIFLLVVLYILVNRNLRILPTLQQSNVAFALAFSFTFAFAVGISTYNFGSLARYKIPLLPFFAVALVIINDLAKVKRPRTELPIG